jgi:hypothetical protein
MGTIIIDVPGDKDLRLEYKLENKEVIDKVINIMKRAGKKVRRKAAGDSIVGIWKDRFDQGLSSELLQRELREKNWKRF